jgi:hypothetical protein
MSSSIQSFNTKTTEVNGADVRVSVNDWGNYQNVTVVVSSSTPTGELTVLGTLILTYEQCSVLNAALTAHELRTV